jgi:hypothetical protein
MRKASLLLSLAALLAGCQTMSYYGDERSPYFVVPGDSRVVLTQQLTIPAEEVSVYLQDGRLMPFAQVNKYHPHCKFEVYTRGATTRTVAPDEFVVTRALQEESPSAALGMRHYAGLRMSSIGSQPGGMPLRTFTTRMYLRSADQPDVYRLSCAQWAYPPYDRHVTIEEIRRALGEVITLQVATR